ncbi:MAG TPA: DNA-binding domain-containing protein, partial [Gammaproteobacteria bacterium]|nr:DNA-binding domain-containing protein [Gammaproteobacteria bacterium]
MTCLSAQQAALQAYMLTPAAEQGIVQHIATTRRASSKVRLDVYAEAYRLRLQEALSTDFEALHGLLGDTQFEQLCLKYIEAHPSQHFSLRYFGQHMSHFLHVSPSYSTQPVLAELAAFEWALIDAFDAPDSELVNLEDIASLPAEHWSTMCLEL